MQFHREMIETKKILELAGHTVYIPSGATDYSRNEFYTKTDEEKILIKVEHDLIREHFRLIGKSDAILVLNYEKKGIADYVGGNTFLEMGFAYGTGKKIFLLHGVPQMEYSTEMHAMQPIVIHGDLSKIS